MFAFIFFVILGGTYMTGLGLLGVTFLIDNEWK